MNLELGERFGDSYRIVLFDNIPSNDAGDRLRKAGLDSGWAKRELATAVRLFHPQKHGKGRLPGSLNFFEPGLLKRWNERGQQEMALLSLERGRKKGPEPVGGAIDEYMAGLERKQERA